MSHPIVIMNKASFYITFYANFSYFEKSLWSSSDLLLDIPYLVLKTSLKGPNLRSPIQQLVDLKLLDPVTYEGHTGITASIILPLFLLRFYACYVVIFEEPLSDRNKENIWNEEDIPYTFFFIRKPFFCLRLNFLNIMLEIRLKFS